MAQSNQRETPELFERFGGESEALAGQTTGKPAFLTEGSGNHQEKCPVQIISAPNPAEILRILQRILHHWVNE